MLDELLQNAPVFLLLFARAIAMIETAPLLSSDSIPQAAKISLALFAAFAVHPSAISVGGMASLPGMTAGLFSMEYALLLVGEAVIGIIIGFFMTIVFAAASSAGQFFSLQMGFGASETFDPLAQIENPLLGQFLNMTAMLTFLLTGGMQTMFLGGLAASVKSLNIIELTQGRENVLSMLLGGLSRLFINAMVISLPILGTLLLTSIATGLISKAAPQINILSEGFPISISVAFILIMATMPFMVEALGRVLEGGFRALQDLYINTGGGIYE
ncbi:MAG: flagellar biosynthetic protein FliR [Spirochaetaceae bacterium]|jgi:flagellar biosynthetic protein FliR|nr:flagellar biosynthetic protein FliR [Spirochaetaceae bacterium]